MSTQARATPGGLQRRQANVAQGVLSTRTSSGQYPALYSAEELIGRRVVCAMNLGTRRIAGVDSQVLLLGAPDSEGRAVLLTTERDVPRGAKVY